MFSSLKARHQTVREDGFTLTELAVAVTILGILLAIALPVFLTAQKHVSSLDVKTGLIQAASAIEAEKGDNNQLYPVYMPNEILSDSLWKTFAYTYSDDRLAYCLQGRDSDGGKWFVSSSNRTPNSTNCGLPNIAKNSETPWQIQFPAVDVSTYNIEWKNNASNPNGSVAWVNAECNEGTTSYQLHIVNATQGIDTKVPSDSQISANNAGLSTFSYSPDLAGWLPDDQTTVSVAAVCTEQTGGRLYTFIGPYTGAAKNAAVPQFPVTNTSYNTAPYAYYEENADKSLTMKASAIFTAVTCPTLTSGVIGTNHPVYELIARQGSSRAGYHVYYTNTGVKLNLSGFAPDTTITYEGRSYCEFTRTSGSVSRYSGTDVKDTNKDGHATTSEFSPVGFPSAPGTPDAVSTNGNNVKPDGLAWSAPSARICAYGGTIQYSYVQSSPASIASAYSAATASGRVNWNEATTYKYYVNAKCVGANRTSDVTPSATLSFTTSALTPAASWRTQYSTSYSSDQLVANGALNSISCPSNSAVRYNVRASQAGESDVVYDGTNNSPTLYLNSTKSSNNGYDGDKLVTYTGYGYCRVTQYDNSTRDWPGASASSSEYAAVAKPTGTSVPYTYTSGNPEVIDNVLQWDAQGCPNGGSIRYRYSLEFPGNFTSGWTTDTNVRDLGWSANVRYYYHIEYYCDGAQGRDSDVIVGSSGNGFVTRFNVPNTPNTTSYAWLDDNGSANFIDTDRVLWNAVDCGRNATAFYIVRQVRTGGNYANPDGGGYRGTDWFTGTNFNIPYDWMRQGSQQGYQVIAQCRNSTGASGNSGWSNEAYYTHRIDTPNGTNFYRNGGDRAVAWGGVGCGYGAYTQYLYQQYNHNEGQTNYSNGFDRGWGNYYSTDIDGYNGYSQGARVYTRCVGDNAVSGSGESNHIDYRIPVYAPRLGLTCKPGSTQDYNGQGNGNCDNITLGFYVGCGTGWSNPNWYGSAQNGNGITIHAASGLSAAQRDVNNGNRFARHGGGSSGSGGGWGAWDASINDTYCLTAHGVGSGGTSWRVQSSTGGGSTT